MADTLSLTSRQQHLFENRTPVVSMPWEQAAAEDRLMASVVVNRPLHAAYSYLIPEHLRGEMQPGQRVRVPFGKGNRLLTGYCVEIGPVRRSRGGSQIGAFAGGPGSRWPRPRCSN